MKRNQYYRPANRNHMSKPNDSFAIFAILAAVLMLIGLSHGSQWSTGFPKSDEGEPYRSEIFADYRFDLWSF